MLLGSCGLEICLAKVAPLFRLSLALLWFWTWFFFFFPHASVLVCCLQSITCCIIARTFFDQFQDLNEGGTDEFVTFPGLFVIISYFSYSPMIESVKKLPWYLVLFFHTLSLFIREVNILSSLLHYPPVHTWWKKMNILPGKLDAKLVDLIMRRGAKYRRVPYEFPPDPTLQSLEFCWWICTALFIYFTLRILGVGHAWVPFLFVCL